VLAASACSGGHGDATPTVVHVSERDFQIHIPTRIPAGDVRLVVHNRGPEQHELIVVRTSDQRLPLRSDAATVDEEGLEPRTLGTLEPGPVGSTRELEMHLRPGTYELLCTVGDHAQLGMRGTLTVKAGS